MLPNGPLNVNWIVTRTEPTKLAAIRIPFATEPGPRRAYTLESFRMPRFVNQEAMAAGWRDIRAILMTEPMLPRELIDD